MQTFLNNENNLFEKCHISSKYKREYFKHILIKEIFSIKVGYQIF
jgi:hypothetical protein